MKKMTRNAFPLILLLAASGARADEIVPATAATEDLKSFDQSVVLPEQAAPRAVTATSMAAEARKLRQEDKSLAKDADPTQRRDGKSAAGLSAESNPVNAPRNSGKKTDTVKGNGKSKH